MNPPMQIRKGSETRRQFEDGTSAAAECIAKAPVGPISSGVPNIINSHLISSAAKKKYDEINS